MSYLTLDNFLAEIGKWLNVRIVNGSLILIADIHTTKTVAQLFFKDVHEVFCSWQQRQGPPLGRMEGHRGGQETAQKDDGASKHCYQRLDINIWKCQPEIFSPEAIMFLSILQYYLIFQTRSLSCWPTKLLTRVWWTRGGKGSALRNTNRSTTSSW